MGHCNVEANCPPGHVSSQLSAALGGVVCHCWAEPERYWNQCEGAALRDGRIWVIGPHSA